MKTFALTNHAIQRLLERNKEFKAGWEKITEPALRKKFAYEYFHGAVEEKAFNNSSTFTTMLGERYGFDKRYRMFVRDDSVFVGMIDGDQSVITTVLNRSEHYCRNLRSTVTKYRAKEAA